jgi:hypothetical protein
MYKQAIFAILITLILALGFGYVVQDFVDGLGKGFVAGLIIQFIIFMLYRPAKAEDTNDEADEALNRVIDLQTTLVECPCGKSKMYEPIFINKDNNFTCNECGSKYRVEIAYESILLTEPVSLVNVFDNLREKEKEFDRQNEL